MAASSARKEAESKLMVSSSTAIPTTKLCCSCLLILLLLSVSHLHLAQGQALISCESKSLDASGYRCNDFGSVDSCATFALFRANSYYFSLFNLTFYLGLNRKAIDVANGFNPKLDLLAKDQALLIPIDCRCNGGYFQADVTKTITKGETFVGISESLEGLTTCTAIQEKNKGLSPWNLKEKSRVPIPLRCACPSQLELKQGTKILLSYPVNVGDSVVNLASKFNTSAGAIISSNNRPGGVPFKPVQKLEPMSTLLIPLTKIPVLTSFLPNPRQPNGTIPKGKPVFTPPKKHKKKKSKTGVFVAVSVIAAGACVAVGVMLMTQMKKKEKKKRGKSFSKNEDLELHHLSVRTKSELKGVSDNFDGQVIDTTPHKMVVGTYSIEDLRKSTEDFHSSNLIEGFVFHGRLNGKNLAVKRTQPETISRIDFGLFHDQFHHHPNIIRLLGTCLVDGPDSFLVFEYAKNGSLKDWLHGGLAMKSQFIASCYCFLTWKQRLKICLDVAMALRYMHHFMIPNYVHRNIKSRNIMLDEDFNAKVGNFGMSRCVQDDAEDSKSLLTHPATWSRGYLAPEYLKHGVISSSVDIFAYGVVLLEVLTGKTPATRADEKGEGSVLLSEKIKAIVEGNETSELKEWVDKAMGDSYSFETALTLAKLAKDCVEQDPGLRPNAREIVDKLSKLVDELPDGDQISSGGSSSKSPVKLPSNDNNL